MRTYLVLTPTDQELLDRVLRKSTAVGARKLSNQWRDAMPAVPSFDLEIIGPDDAEDDDNDD